MLTRCHPILRIQCALGVGRNRRVMPATKIVREDSCPDDKKNDWTGSCAKARRAVWSVARVTTAFAVRRVLPLACSSTSSPSPAPGNRGEETHGTSRQEHAVKAGVQETAFQWYAAGVVYLVCTTSCMHVDQGFSHFFEHRKGRRGLGCGKRRRAR